MALTSWLAFPPDVVESSALAQPSNLPGSGRLVMTRNVPDCELAPYNVPCGPRNASMRATSMSRGSGLRPLWVMGCSSRYNADEDTAPNCRPEVETPRNMIVVPPVGGWRPTVPGRW